MDYVISVVSLKTRKPICEFAFKADSLKEARAFVSDWISHAYFKNKDICFKLLKRDGFTFAEV